MYLYHLVPPRFLGWEIIPLNFLKRIDFEMYKKYFNMYAGRENVTKENIPLLDCMWGDAIFLTAVAPQTWRKVFDELGYPTGKLSYFQIQPEILRLSASAVLDYDENGNKIYKWFDPHNLPDYSTIREATLSYYRQAHKSAEPIFWHHLVPQILYRGTLNISGTPIVEV